MERRRVRLKVRIGKRKRKREEREEEGRETLVWFGVDCLVVVLSG